MKPQAYRSPLRSLLILCTLCSLCSGEATAADATFEDSRDGRVYPLIQANGLLWFGANLAWASPGSFCYGDDDINCDKYGRLYRWEEALAACPTGSHLASDLEWASLERSVGLPQLEIDQRRNRGSIEGARLKVGGNSGFDAQYGGWRRYQDGGYRSADDAAAYWTSTEIDLGHAQHRDIDVGDDMIWRSPVPKRYALSVRCVVDNYGGDETLGDDTHPVFSPDGRRIAFISNREGVAVDHPINFEIYVLDLETKRGTRLTFNDAFEADLAWSPDGTRIAFKSFRDGNDEVYVMAADGSGQTNLTQSSASDGGPSFMPDGRELIFSSDRDGDRELYRMNVDGSNVRQLTYDPSSDNSPSVSPDGQRVAFVSDRDGNDETYTLTLDTGDVERMTEAPLSDWSPVWSPAGDALLVTYGDWETDTWSLIRVAIADKSRTVLAEGNDSGNAAWREQDGVLAFGAPLDGEEDDPHPARIHLFVPGGTHREPVTGRMAGVYDPVSN